MNTEEQTFECPADCNTLEIWCETPQGVFNPLQWIDLSQVDPDVFMTNPIRLRFKFLNEDWSKIKPEP